MDNDFYFLFDNFELPFIDSPYDEEKALEFVLNTEKYFDSFLDSFLN